MRANAAQAGRPESGGHGELPGAPDDGSVVVTTRTIFAAPPERVWSWLTYYEQIEERPPLVLRLLLPVPTRTEGKKSRVGDVARCLYNRGHLVKRVTAVESGRRLAFDVVEQALLVGRGLSLSGGAYGLREVARGTEITLSTRYVSVRGPRWLWKPIEAAVCHAFHRHILRAMRRSARGGPPGRA